MTYFMPKKGSSAEKVLMYLFHNGAQTVTMLQSRTGVKRDSLVKVLRDYGCVNTEFGYRLPTGHRTALEKLHPKSAITQPRCTTIWTPEMKGYDARMRAGRRYE